MTQITDASYFERFTPRQKEAAKLLDGALAGDRTAAHLLKEGIATSDIASALSPTLNYLSLQNYAQQPKVWDQFAERNILDNFLAQPYYNMQFDDQSNIPPGYSGDNFIAGALPTVKEYAPYPTISFTASTAQLQLKKSGESIQFSWESIINDNQLGLLAKVPAAFGKHAAGREDSEATKGLVTATGLNTTLFTGATVIAPGSTAPLTLANLQNAIQLIALQTYNGARVSPAARYRLVVPPALELTARNILSITQVETQVTSGSTVTSAVSNNPIGNVDLVVNPWITAINPAATSAWFLIPAPGTSSQNPPILVNFLRGYETPEIWVKDNASYLLGGGKVPERRGSFDNDDYQLRTRHTATGGILPSAGYIGTLGTAS